MLCLAGNTRQRQLPYQYALVTPEDLRESAEEHDFVDEGTGDSVHRCAPENMTSVEEIPEAR